MPDALPAAVVTALQNKAIDLKSPATTVTLIKLGAVVGIVGQVDANDNLTKVGTTCAFCHSTVDNSLAPGIGYRLDGWPNRDLNVGAVIALSPAVTGAQKAVYQSWGPESTIRDSISTARTFQLVIPPAFGLRHVDRRSYGRRTRSPTGTRTSPSRRCTVTGSSLDPRVGVAVSNLPDLVSSELAALRTYQLSLETPPPAPEAFDKAAAERGRAVFNSVARCASCHVGSVCQHGCQSRHTAHSSRSRTGSRIRAPQRFEALSHDAAARTMASASARRPIFSRRQCGDPECGGRSLRPAPRTHLTPQQKADLIEYLKTL